MKNTVSPESKEAAIKTLAIIGFIVAVVVFLWLAVQVVRLVPSAWSTLASLAESVYGTSETLSIATSKSIVNSGEVLTVSWTKLRTDGAYVLSYRCTDGVSAEARTKDGDIVAIDCEEKLSLAGAAQNIEVIFTSEKKRFTDVPFSVSFIPRGDSQNSQDKNGIVTVVNAEISQSDTVGIDDSETVAPSTGVSTGAGAPSGSVTTKPVTTTYYPVSNPNGFTDLQVTYLGIGAFNKNTGVFTPGTQIDNDVRSAVRFEVKNIGTKTSGTWTFDADLMGYDFESNPQAALRPNERAIITLGFDEITTDTGTEKISVDVEGGNDTRQSNNSFTWSVKVVD